MLATHTSPLAGEVGPPKAGRVRGRARLGLGCRRSLPLKARKATLSCNRRLTRRRDFDDPRKDAESARPSAISGCNGRREITALIEGIVRFVKETGRRTTVIDGTHFETPGLRPDIAARDSAASVFRN
jgi:hypothetical protein